MSHELWRNLEEEEDGETRGRKPEIGHIFLLDRGNSCWHSSVFGPRSIRNVENVVAQTGPSGWAVHAAVFGGLTPGSGEGIGAHPERPGQQAVAAGPHGQGSGLQTWTL